MERVQFQQEQMLDELKDLVEKGLFTRQETKQIMKQRTTHERNLVRRISQKSDFLRYIEYERTLEQLRKKRYERLKRNAGNQRIKTTISDHSIVRRQFAIFERALKKFKADVGLWVQYINVAKSEGARILVGRICARALQLHPGIPALYVLAAAHELDHASPTAARTLLQRGIRLNPESVEMWKEYVKMELNFVESMRRRWEVLGIDTEETPGGVASADEDMESASARKEIMGGAIVKAVMNSAVKALPSWELLESIHALIESFPSPQPLRSAFLDQLQTISPSKFRPRLAELDLASLEGEALINGLQDVNERLSNAVRDRLQDAKGKAAQGEADSACTAYVNFVNKWCANARLNQETKEYMVSSLALLISTTATNTANRAGEPARHPILCVGHIRSLIACGDAHRACQVGRRYTGFTSKKKNNHLRHHDFASNNGSTDATTSPVVWLAFMDACTIATSGEQHALSAESGAELERIWKVARVEVRFTEGQECDKDIERVWVWGLEKITDVGTAKSVIQALLDESMRLLPGAAYVHEQLLIRLSRLPSGFVHGDARKWSMRWVPTPRVWANVFATLSGTDLTTTSYDGDGDNGDGGGHLHHHAAAQEAEEGVDATPRSAGGLTNASLTITNPISSPSLEHGKNSLGTAELGAVLEEVYNVWRVKDEASAALAWATWLLIHSDGTNGQGMRAAQVVRDACTRLGLGSAQATEVEARWTAVLSSNQSRHVDEEEQDHVMS